MKTIRRKGISILLILDLLVFSSLVVNQVFADGMVKKNVRVKQNCEETVEKTKTKKKKPVCKKQVIVKKTSVKPTSTNTTNKNTSSSSSKSTSSAVATANATANVSVQENQPHKEVVKETVVTPTQQTTPNNAAMTTTTTQTLPSTGTDPSVPAGAASLLLTTLLWLRSRRRA